MSEDLPTGLPDPGRLRDEAKDLKRALDDGSAEARERVRASHPKFAGCPADRLEGRVFGLQDAQATVAREHRFDSWKAMLEAAEGEQVIRWDAVTWDGALGRAFKEARHMSHRVCTEEHIVLALLSPPEPTAAAEVLTEKGLTYDAMADRASRLGASSPGDGDGVRSTPAYHLISGMAQGIAIGLGATGLTDEHVLMAFAFGDDRLTSFEIDAHDVITGLRERGVAVPNVAPPVAKTPYGPWGPLVYFPQEDFSLVTQAILKQFPLGTAGWGTNQSSWKPGYWYVNGEDEIPMEQIVKSAATDPSTIEVLDFKEGNERELSGLRSEDPDQ